MRQNINFVLINMSHTKSTPDNSLLQQVAYGSESAFTRLYEQWQPRVSAYIYKLSGSKELTAEIVQDVFLKLWLQREALTSIINFESYLFTLCRNHAINALKKTMRDLKQIQTLEELLINQVEAPEDDVYQKRLSVLDESIDLLTPRQKEIYLLHRHQRLTYQEIANRLGIGKESVKSHLQQAMKSILRNLQDRKLLLWLLIEIFAKKL